MQAGQDEERAPPSAEPPALGPRLDASGTTRQTLDEPGTAPAMPSRMRSHADTALLPGATLGDTYRIVRVLGVGGMGTVYLARDEGLDRLVALKVVRSHLASQPLALERFRAEARTMARLSHPHVVGVHALGETDGRPYLVMEYVPGTPLSRFVHERGEPLRAEEVLAILDQVCRGVAALHAAGLVHRDLKPGNILIGPAFRVVVSDLGLSHGIGQATSSWGTPGYTAPELCSGEPPPADLARRVDVYSIGAMAYELLTGQLPFGTQAEWTFAMLEARPPPPPSSLRPALGTALDAPVLEALAWSPELRTASVDALRRALGEAALSTHPAPRRPLRFLVVDDDPAYATLASRFLVRAFPGAVVEAAEDGGAALRASAGRVLDLVVTDLDMPDMNGMELTAALRAQPSTADVPIIVASAVGGATDWSLLGRLGANAFLGKPFDAAQLGLLARMLVA